MIDEEERVGASEACEIRCDLIRDGVKTVAQYCRPGRRESERRRQRW